MQTKPSLRVKKLSKKSQKYITDLQATIMRIGDKETTQPNKKSTKRKHNNCDINHLLSNTERISPDSKKPIINSINSDDSGFSSPEQANTTKTTPTCLIAIKKLVLPPTSKNYPPHSQEQSIKTNPTYVQVAMKTNKPTTQVNQFTTLICADNSKKVISNQNSTVIQQGKCPPTMIPLSQYEPPTAISTTSTLTPNTGIAHRSVRFSNDQVVQLKKRLNNITITHLS